jgi:hypothetical protein
MYRSCTINGRREPITASSTSFKLPGNRLCTARPRRPCRGLEGLELLPVCSRGARH